MTSLNIAFLPIARTTFDLDYAREKTKVAFKQLSDEAFEILGSEDLVTDAVGVQEAISGLGGKEIDLLLVFQATFADSSMVMELANAIDAPLFLWAVPEPHTGGRLRLNSMCGINLAGHALTRNGIYYEHFYTNPGDPAVIEAIASQARAGRARRVLKGARLGRVGENPDGFESCLFDADSLAERFGLEIVQFNLQDDLFSKVQKLEEADTQPILDELSAQVNGIDEMDMDAVHGTLGVYKTLQDTADQAEIQGYAIRCWPEFFTELGCAACGAMSMLSDELIPSSCEADVNGTITQLILQSLSGEQAFGTDMVSVDQERDALVLWHCGLAPLSMADPEAEKRVTIHSNRKLPLLMEFPLKPGRVTIARLSEASGDYVLVVGEGEMIRSSLSFSGTSGLVKFDKPALDVLDTILGKGLEHHISITYGSFKEELLTLANMLNLPVMQIT